MLLPMVAGIMVASIGSGQLISRTGRYKIFMQVGFVVATIAIALLSTLTPESSYLQEAITMVFLGLGMGVAMPVINLAVQNEFEQKELGVATSSSQLFRSLGSTIGTAVFGALLTAGIISGLGNVQQDAYIQSLSRNQEASQIGKLDDANTLLTLNMPDMKNKINDAADKSIEVLPEPVKEEAKKQFIANQDGFADKVTHAFSDSLRTIFLVATGLMVAATVLVFMVKERPLRSAKASETPGEA